jgi:ring-1,2-phenylacetyl-CoA epoxidase subunit PaaD
MVTQKDILDVLRTIDDPEMPISIIDLGIINDVRIDLTDSKVEIDVLPTFVGCPALPAIEDEIRRRLGSLAGVKHIDVHFLFDPPWSADRITSAGRERLKKFGVTVPRRAPEAAAGPDPTCPYCGSRDVSLESPFGPTRCRMIYHCASCKNPFEHIKRLELRLV